MSMSLIDMATLITMELGLYDETSLVLTKAFLNKQYTSLWDKYPWSDTQTATETTVDLGESTLPYPVGMDRIITIRARNFWLDPDSPEDNPDYIAQPFKSDARFLDPVTSTYLVETDPDMFERSGPVKYYEESADLVTGEKSIRLYPRPNHDTRLYIIGKGVCPGLASDTASSIIRNIDPTLMAYAYADMLQRQRQYGKADLKRKEAQELEANAWNLEQQQANQPRMTKATTVAGNSLAEMTDAVCMICGQWIPEYRLMIREFLRRNYQTLYDTFLWPESLVMVRVGFTTEQVVMPAYIDKVLGIRGATDMRMFPADAGLILDITPSAFDDIGDPVSYTTLTPVGVSTLPPETTQLTLASTSSIDTSSVFIRGEVISTGQELAEEVVLNGVNPVFSRYSYDIPLTVAKDQTVGDVTVNATSDGRSLEILPASVRELKHQRFWFLPAPDSTTDEDFTCLVLGKRIIRPLLTDQDTPIITGAQQVLIAAAASDVFRKLEKPEMANAMLQKADGSMKVLKDKNTDQAASAPRFVPQVEPRAYVSGCCTW